MKAKTNTVLIAVALLAYWVGLCNTHAFYDPCMQCWLNRDPIYEWGGYNLYAFVKNNPFSWIDSDGGAPIPCSDMTSLINNNNQSGLDTDIIKCIAFRESSFNPEAVSPDPKSTAAGLMGMNNRADADVGAEQSMMGNAAYNIHYGTKYLALRVKWAHGNITQGLNGYGGQHGYGKAIQDCVDCLKKNKSGPNGANNPCDQNCLNKANGK